MAPAEGGGVTASFVQGKISIVKNEKKNERSEKKKNVKNEKKGLRRGAGSNAAGGTGLSGQARPGQAGAPGATAISGQARSTVQCSAVQAG